MLERPTELMAPAVVRLAGGYLVPDTGAADRLVTLPNAVLLSFARLADAPDRTILAFVRRRGLLHLCIHDLPWLHRTGTGLCGELRPDGREPVEAWRLYARRARGIIRLSNRLREDRLDTGTVQDGLDSIAGLGPWDDQETMRRMRATARDRGALGRLLAGEVERWLDFGNVTLHPRWSTDDSPLGRLVPQLGSRGPNLLMSALATELFAVAAGRATASCHECGRLFQPARRPSPGRRSYCPACRKAGASRRDAWRDSKRRARAQA